MIKKFWRITLENKTNIWIASIIFILSIFIGYYYVNEQNQVIQTLFTELKNIAEEIKNNDTSTFMIYTIFLNNISAAIKMILFGVFFGFFPIMALLANGVIIGFFLKNAVMPMDSVYVFLVGILPHGIIEIPAIIIAAAFGMKLGFSVVKLIVEVLNKENRRYNANRIKETIRQIPTVILGLTILLLIAAVIESTITGYLLSLITI